MTKNLLFIKKIKNFSKKIRIKKEVAKPAYGSGRIDIQKIRTKKKLQN